jgi:hypothetical protein
MTGLPPETRVPAYQPIDLRARFDRFAKGAAIVLADPFGGRGFILSGELFFVGSRRLCRCASSQEG